MGTRLRHAIKAQFSLFASFAQGFNMLSMSRSRSSHPSSKARTCLQSQILDRHTPCGRLRHAIKVKFLLFASFAQGFNMTSPHNSFSPQPSYKASTCHQSPSLALRILRARLQRAFDVNISLFTSLEQGPHMPSKSNSRSPHPLRKASPCPQRQILALRILRTRLQHDFTTQVFLSAAFLQGFDMPSKPNSRSSHPSSKAHTCLQSQILDRRTPCGSLHHAIKV